MILSDSPELNFDDQSRLLNDEVFQVKKLSLSAINFELNTADVEIESRNPEEESIFFKLEDCSYRNSDFVYIRDIFHCLLKSSGKVVGALEIRATR